MKAPPRLLFHNWAWKLGSLGLAILLWSFVIGEPDLVTVQTAGVYFENLPAGLMIASDVPGTVQLELRGPSAVLDRQNLSSVKILLNLSSVVVPGQQSYTISSRDVTLPAGVSFLSAVPSRLFLEFDRRSSKDVPVRADLKGSPAAGFRVVKSSINPGLVRVSGPESRLRELEAAMTDAIALEGLDHSVSVISNAYLTDPMLQLDSPARLTVDITIERGSSTP